MPRIRPGMPKPPKGFDAVSGLDRFDAEMREAVASSSDGKRKVESTWGVTAVVRRKTRWFLDEIVRPGVVSKAVIEYCIQQRFVDGELLKLWVPAAKRKVGALQCANCGCSGCASGDKAAAVAVASTDASKRQEFHDEVAAKRHDEQDGALVATDVDGSGAAVESLPERKRPRSP